MPPNRPTVEADPRDGLDDDAIRAFTLGFLDGLRHREATVRDQRFSAARGVADHG